MIAYVLGQILSSIWFNQKLTVVFEWPTVEKFSHFLGFWKQHGIKVFN